MEKLGRHSAPQATWQRAAAVVTAAVTATRVSVQAEQQEQRHRVTALGSKLPLGSKHHSPCPPALALAWRRTRQPPQPTWPGRGSPQPAQNRKPCHSRG